MLKDLDKIIKWLEDPQMSVSLGYEGYDCPITGDHFWNEDKFKACRTVLSNLKKKYKND